MSPKPNKILHLEDDEMIVRLVALTLIRHGIEITVDHVATRPLFIQALATGHYGLVLSDAQLPGFSGKAALDIVRNRQPRLPFIFLTGTVHENDALAAIEAGAQEYLNKDHLWRLPFVIANALSLHTVKTQRSINNALDYRRTTPQRT